LNIGAARQINQAIADVTDLPIKYVAYTSSFFDQVAGGQIFKDQGAQVVAHENCAANLKATPRADIVPPDIVYADHLEISVGDAGLGLYYFGESYGTCLSVMIARPANVMLIMNLVNPPAARVPPDPTLANYYLHNLVPFFRSAETLAADENVTQVAGAYAQTPTGPDRQMQVTPTLGPANLITEQRIFWETLFDVVKIEYDRRTPAQVIPQKADMTRLETYPGFDRQHVGTMMRRVYSLYRIGR